MSSEEWLRTRVLSHLERKRPRGHRIALRSLPRRGHGEGGAISSPWDPGMGCLGSVQSCVHQERLRLDVVKHLFYREGRQTPEQASWRSRRYSVPVGV